MKNSPLMMGIDLGTSSTKLLLCSVKGKILKTVQVANKIHSPRLGWNEQDPIAWWDGVQKGIRQLCNDDSAKRIGAIGLSGQMHGSVFLDKRGEVLCKALLWNDQRTQEQCKQITRSLGGERRTIQKTLNQALTGYTAPKILWLRDERPKLYEKIRTLLLPKDYIRYRLTGEFATDVADASGTLLLNIKKRNWHLGVLKSLDIDPKILPPVFESHEVASQLSAKIAKTLGMRAGIPVVAGAGDQQAAAVGMGVIHQGTLSATIGTSGVVFAATEFPYANSEGLLQSFCHALPNKWCVFGCMLSAGGSLAWVRDRLFKKKSFEWMIKQAARAKPGSQGLFFLPYLEGERCPHPDPTLRSGWVGLSRHHNRSAMIRAVLEGVTLGMADQVQLMRKLGIEVSEIRCAGGGARDLFWRKMQANAYGAQMSVSKTENASAYGAAILAGVGARIWDSVEQACEMTLRRQHLIQPKKKWVEFYRSHHVRYQQLVELLKPHYQAQTPT